MSKLLVTIVCLVLSSYEGKAKLNTQDSIFLSETQLRSDLHYFRNVLEKAHPSLYRYISKDSLDKSFSNAFEKLNHPMAVTEFWKLLQSIAVKICCGHTSLKAIPVSFSNLQKKEYSFLPFYVSVTNDKLFIVRYIRSPTNTYKIGDEIVSINGDSAGEILRKVRSMISADGYSNSYKDYQIEKGAFNWIYGILNKPVSEFDMELKRKGDIIKIKVPAWPYSVAIPRNKAINDSIRPRLVTYPSDIPSTAIFRLGGFKNQEYINYHKALFKDLHEKSISNLILDLRNNPGGKSDEVIDLMKYLVPKEFYFTKHTEGIVDRADFSSFFQTTQSPRLEDLNGIISLPYRKEFAGSMLQTPHKKQYNGKVYVLINGGTFSSAALLATALKTQSDCITIGQETGSGNAGCNGGMTLSVTLPKSLIKFTLPLMWTYSTSSDPDKGMGLLPDHFVKSNTLRIDDAYGQFDAAITQAKRLINSSQTSK
ncbi:MAG: S41 family peptidase [Sphingobacteriaceae bacterium]